MLRFHRSLKARRQVLEWTTEDRVGGEYMLPKARALNRGKDPSFVVASEVAKTSIAADTEAFFDRIQAQVLQYLLC